MSNSIIERIFAASADPCIWEYCLAQLAEEIGAQYGQLLVVDEVRRCPLFSVTGMPSTRLRHSSERDTHGLDAALLALAREPGNSGWRTQVSYIPVDIPRRSSEGRALIRYARGWTLSNRIALHQELQILMGFHRLAGSPAFTVREQGVLERLSEALRHSGIQLANYFSTFGRTHPGYDALNHLPAAFVIADCESQVYFANRAAGRFLEQGDGLVLSGNRLRALVRPELLRDAIRQAVASDRWRVLLVARQGVPEPYQVTVSPLPNAELLCASKRRPCALVKITLPESRPLLKTDLLGTLYGLTPAETRLAAGLFDGMTPGVYASEAGVSIHTVRTQIRSILEKTNTARQVDLIKLLAVQVC